MAPMTSVAAEAHVLVFNCVGALPSNSNSPPENSPRTKIMLGPMFKLSVCQSLTVPLFSWTSIQLNRGTVSEWHAENLNIGPIMILVLGEFSGGANSSWTAARPRS